MKSLRICSTSFFCLFVGTDFQVCSITDSVASAWFPIAEGDERDLRDECRPDMSSFCGENFCYPRKKPLGAPPRGPSDAAMASRHVSIFLQNTISKSNLSRPSHHINNAFSLLVPQFWNVYFISSSFCVDFLTKLDTQWFTMAYSLSHFDLKRSLNIFFLKETIQTPKNSLWSFLRKSTSVAQRYHLYCYQSTFSRISTPFSFNPCKNLITIIYLKCKPNQGVLSFTPNTSFLRRYF